MQLQSPWMSNFMTSKEKSYVAECFRRNMKYLRSDVDYAALFSSQKIEISAEDEPRRSVSLVFGKESKKKRLRPSFGMDVEELPCVLRTRCVLETLIDLQTVRRCCNLSEEALQENSSAVQAVLDAEFAGLMSVGKFFGFLAEHMQTASGDGRREAVMHLQRTFHLIGDVSAFYGFVNASINEMPAMQREELEPGFASMFLLFPCGVILATALLIQNEDLSSLFCDAVVADSSNLARDRYTWQFLSVLVSLVDEERLREVVRKTQPILVELVSSPEGAGQARQFLDAIGLRPEDIQK